MQVVLRFRQSELQGDEELKVSNEKGQPFNYSKLKARTVEMELMGKDVAAALQMSASTYSIKLNGKAEFSQSEIRKICEVLQIEAADIPVYFFAERV